MKYATVAELTRAHPDWRKAASMPADILSVAMVAVYTQRSPYSVLAAMRAGQLRATQSGKGGMWQALLPDVQRWALRLPPNRALARTGT